MSSPSLVFKAGDVRREDFESPLLQAQSMRKLGRLEESRVVNREAVRRAEALYPDDMGVIINGAILRARNNLTEEALDLLDRVFSKGWGKKDWVENDPDYDSLRGEPRFIAMMANLK